MPDVVSGMDDMKKRLAEAGDKLVVVDFYADWCGPCRMIAPKFQKMAEDTPEVVFLKVNVDETDDVATEYQVSAMPTFVFIKSGKKVAEIVGANETKISEAIAKHK